MAQTPTYKALALANICGKLDLMAWNPCMDGCSDCALRKDFVAMVADTSDVFVTESLDKKTLHHLKERFLTEFSDFKIVFSSQIYCCNPWELREFGRRDWDAYYNKRGDIPSMYKHLNAGVFMGYASAILEMADQMKIW